MIDAFGVKQFFVVGRPVHCRMFSSPPGLDSPDASSTPLPAVTTKTVFRHCHMFPGAGDSVVFAFQSRWGKAAPTCAWCSSGDRRWPDPAHQDSILRLKTLSQHSHKKHILQVLAEYVLHARPWCLEVQIVTRPPPGNCPDFPRLRPFLCAYKQHLPWPPYSP